MLSSVSFQRFAFRSLLITASAVIAAYIFLVLSGPESNSDSWLSRITFQNRPYHPELARVPCVGPRGVLLTKSTDDQLQSHYIDRPYPRPLGGSYDTLSLAQTWMTAEERYGPYGYGDEDIANYGRSLVTWNSVNWASLQDRCFVRNDLRFRNSKRITEYATLSKPSKIQGLKTAISSIRRSRQSTGRTAIVIRTWGTYNYRKEDMTNLRSLIAETALASGGEYAVFLLVHIKDRDKRIFSSTQRYQAAIEETVPPEFRDMAVLFDESLLEAWYPKVSEHSPYYQMAQPMQLFAQVFDGFDHYWQWEMDTRLTGDSLHYLEAMSRFAKFEPRKQSVERGSFRYIPEIHGGYKDLQALVNASVGGRGVWGPVRIPEIPKPIGPVPPVADPLDDDFQWGVGEEADFIPTTTCKSLPLTTSWLFNNTLSGFSAGVDTPRLFCPQAVARISWNLLSAVHAGQMEKGLYVPSEATLPSFALWHGLKITQPPQPWFIVAREDVPQDARSLDLIVNGGAPKAERLGFAFGTNSWDDEVLDHYNWRTEQSWHWRSKLPKEIMDKWFGLDKTPINGTPLANILHVQDGQVFAPNLWLHPYKTNPG